MHVVSGSCCNKEHPLNYSLIYLFESPKEFTGSMNHLVKILMHLFMICMALLLFLTYTLPLNLYELFILNN